MPPESGAEPKGLVTLPTGTVTFLFSDIEGSTQRWEANRDGMDAAVKRHDAVMRAAIAQRNGYVFKTVGDAFCAAFSRVVDAAMAVIDAQRALATEDFSGVDGLRVRMALHVGEASERDGDYFGPTVNRVARLMSIGHGGQVLLSDAVYELVRTQLPADVSFADLGLRRLKDLTQPEQVWQLFAEGLGATFPPLNSLDARPNNLPIQATSLIGRERDLEDVKSLVGKHHLVTLSGSGGVGKTRVALQVGADLIDRYPNGAWFADLAPIRDPKLVSSVVAKVLGISVREGRTVEEAITQRLKREQLLLILDNCEHVLAAVAELTDAILKIAPDVRLLATSRQALGIGGEVLHRLPSLAIPDNVVGLRTPDALQYGAIALFVDRAKAADTRFSLSDDTAPIVADICRRLDGIPLAIELAAARVKVLSIPNLAQRLNDRFKILIGGSRSALPRQKTLTALIDWSYDLLSPQEQTLFTRAAIFAGFSLDAATAVCAGEGLDEIDILDLLSSLTDKSLVVADTGGEQERYRLLESTRAYALEKLIAAGERERLARRHGEYFRDKAQEADKRFGTGSTLAWFADMELELDNYRAALEGRLSQGSDAVLGAAIAGALEQFWYEGGLAVEGRYWIEPALERVNLAENPQIAARLWLALAILHSGKRRYEAAEQAVSLYESAGDDRGAARARVRLAWGLYQMGRLNEANETSMRALTALREYGDKGGVAGCLRTQGAIASSRGAIAEGRNLYEQALAVYKALGDEIGAAIVLGNLAELEFADGHPEQALRSISEAQEMMSSSRGVEALNMAIYRSNGAAYRIALGDIDGACASAREGLSFARQAQDAKVIAEALQHLALLMALVGQTQSAVKLLGYIEVQLKGLGVTREPTEKWGHEKLMATLRQQLSDAEIEKLAAEGAAWSEDRAVEEALKV